MRVVDAAKLCLHREMVDAYVAEHVVSQGLSRPRAYLSVLRELGNCAHITNSRNGWWHGVSHELGSSLELPISTRFSQHTVESARSKIGRAKALLASRDRGSQTEAEELLADASDGLERFFPCAIAADFLDSFVFGVSPESVATALILVALDPELDLFLDQQAFSEIYPRSEWETLFGGLPVDLIDRPDPNQMMLFEGTDVRVDAMLKQGLWELRTLGPIASAWSFEMNA